jgi:hypothetical protein
MFIHSFIRLRTVSRQFRCQTDGANVHSIERVFFLGAGSFGLRALRRPRARLICSNVSTVIIWVLIIKEWKETQNNVIENYGKLITVKDIYTKT